MAKTIILKDIDNNICYPKTIKNNIYGLVSELNEIKQAIGIEPPDNIIVLFKGSTAPSTTMSDFGDNVKLGDLYLKTSATKTMYYVSDMDNQNDTIAWTELADQNSVSRVVQDVLSTDTQVGASLANNTGFVTTLAANESFATTFLSTTGASVASVNASFGQAIAKNQAMLYYWFGSTFLSASGNLYSWLGSDGNYLMTLLFSYGMINDMQGVKYYFSSYIPWGWLPRYDSNVWNWLKNTLIYGLDSYDMISMWRQGVAAVFNDLSRTTERRLFFEEKHIYCGRTAKIGISPGGGVSNAKIFGPDYIYPIVGYGNRLFIVLSNFYASANKCSIDLSIPGVPLMHLSIDGLQAYARLNLRFTIDVLAGYVYGCLYESSLTSYSASMVPILDTNVSNIFKLSSIGEGTILTSDVLYDNNFSGSVYADI